MNLSETLDRILYLRQQGEGAERQVADFLNETFAATGAHVEIQRFSYSAYSRPLVSSVVLLLTVAFLVSVIRRRHRTASIFAFAIPLILILELSSAIHIVSWPVQKRSENIIVHFPVQYAARRVIVTTRTAAGYDRQSRTSGPNRFRETLSAFLLPMTIVITLLGMWQLVAHFVKLDSEDARTVTLIMGMVCTIYFAMLFWAWIGSAGRESRGQPDPSENAGSIAVLAALAEDLAQKYPRLGNTWVEVVFLGGSGYGGDEGAKLFARNLGRRHKSALPTYVIECDEIGGVGGQGFLIPGDGGADPRYADSELARVLNRASAAVAGRQLEIIPLSPTSSSRFIDYGYPSIVLSTAPRENSGGFETHAADLTVDRGRLLLSLQLIERALSEFENPQIHPLQPGRY